MMKVEIVKGDITEMKIEAIVNPSNSYLTMGGGLAGLISRKGGPSIREEARKYAPVEVGKAVVTSAGNLPCKFVIHAPTMREPAQRIGVENVRKAIGAVLECAEENNISEIAMPGLGTGVGGVDPEEAARVMLEEIKKFNGKSIKRIILVAYNDYLYNAFRDAI